MAGGGECRHPSLSGSWWCYVDTDNNDCPDSVPDHVQVVTETAGPSPINKPTHRINN